MEKISSIISLYQIRIVNINFIGILLCFYIFPWRFIFGLKNERIGYEKQTARDNPCKNIPFLY